MFFVLIRTMAMLLRTESIFSSLISPGFARFEENNLLPVKITITVPIPTVSVISGDIKVIII
jgi:hypothetical protein